MISINLQAKMRQRLCFFIILFCFVSPFVGATEVPYQWKVPAIYVFGDSTADVGNNNYLSNTTAKANFPHNGIDFPYSRPTGRFSNGYIVIDFIASHMGFRRSPPPYLSLNDTNNHQVLKGLRGVNFASAGSGILDTTGITNIIMTQQVKYFEALRSKMMAQPNTDPEALNLRISKSLFLISSGANDAFRFFTATKLPNNTAVSVFFNTIISKYENHIKTLYDLGARKFAIINVPLIGCTPSVRILNSTGGCIDGMNQLAKSLGDEIAALYGRLSIVLPGFQYSIGKFYELLSTAISKPHSYGFQEVERACCGSGKLNAQVYCRPNSTLCMNRNRYIFWDQAHATQRASKISGSIFYNGPTQFVSPITYKQLVEK